MKSLKKISTVQLYMMWKNLSMSLLLLIVMMTLSKLLPPICSPLASLACAAYLYTTLYGIRKNTGNTCALLPYSIFVCLISYSFITIIMNLMALWHLIPLSGEFVFFTDPFIPSLLLNPICFFCITILYMRRKKLRICVECRIGGSASTDQGRLGNIFTHESYLQLRNLMLMFGLLSTAIWLYYLLFYIKINANARDWYVFTWLNVITFILDEFYFMFRYYNLYLDLKENNEIISEEEIADMGAQTYVRYYVVCGNNVYVDPHAVEDELSGNEVIDTPFQTRRSVNGMTMPEVKRIIGQMTGVNDGELKFFFGRRNPVLRNSSLLRYLYFIEPEPDGSLPKLRTDGEWMDYDVIQHIYATNHKRLASLSVSDTTRLATIILTEKIFNEEGFRKSRLKIYNPRFTLVDVRNSNLDFQDDKWIRVSMFNSDTPFFRIKRWWRKLTGRMNNKHKENQWL